ncbi:MAG: TrkA family potassium uptake protein [bacterium]
MKRFAVIGLSTFGRVLAEALFKLGSEVLVIDRNREKINDVEDKVTSAVVADATNKKVLKKLSLKDMDGVIVSTGGQANTSILISLYLKELDVKNITVKSLDDDHEKILKMVGAHHCINPERDMAVRLAENLHSPNFLEFVNLAKDYNIVELAPPRNFIGKTLAQLELRKNYNIQVIGIREIIPPNMVLVPNADFEIKDSDVLVVVAKEKDLLKLREKN